MSMISFARRFWVEKAPLSKDAVVDIVKVADDKVRLAGGHFTDETWQHADRVRCPKCFAPTEYRGWESDDGGFEDTKYRCVDCEHTWWRDLTHDIDLVR